MVQILTVCSRDFFFKIRLFANILAMFSVYYEALIISTHFAFYICGLLKRLKKIVSGTDFLAISGSVVRIWSYPHTLLSIFLRSVKEIKKKSVVQIFSHISGSVIIAPYFVADTYGLFKRFFPSSLRDSNLLAMFSVCYQDLIIAPYFVVDPYGLVKRFFYQD